MGPVPTAPATLVLEIGTEEIPSTPLYRATDQLAALAEAALAEVRVAHGEITVRSTPRRLILEVRRVAPQSTPLVQKSRGPAVAVAFDAQGNPTAAAEGFARGKGVAVRDLVREKEGANEYVYAFVEQLARRTETLLPELLGNLIARLSWPKSQRWGTGEASFVRPVRWLLALWGQRLIPVQFAGLVAGRHSWGHRLLANHALEVTSADELSSVHSAAWVIAAASIRAAHIRAQIQGIEEKTGLSAHVPAEILAEVVNLVEFPTTLLGSFDAEFLEVPREIITDAMLKHQRYFPLYNADGSLSNQFLVVSNGSPSYNSAIVAGHERVVRPRLADAAFFYREDLKRPLESYVNDLQKVVFHEKLGSLYLKTQRIAFLAERAAVQLGVPEQLAAEMRRAAWLAKADLVCSAVVEFPKLQGIMGSYYALAEGDSPAVAQAIAEHYRPRFAGDELPATAVGCVVALADKIDSICGIFAVGQGPTGSSDPFALRRAAIGVINILLAGVASAVEEDGAAIAEAVVADGAEVVAPAVAPEAAPEAVTPVAAEAVAAEAVAADVTGAPSSLSTLSLTGLIDDALLALEVVVSNREAVRQQVHDFFATRLEVIARERGFAADAVQAVLATGAVQPADVIARLDALTQARAHAPELFANLATAYARANNLRDPGLDGAIDEELLGAPERALYEATLKVAEGVNEATRRGQYAHALEFLASLRGPIDRFFEEVLIMSEDERLRRNRLLLLDAFTAVFNDIADFSRLAPH
ncbi:MAG: glycine--tRNA ligase subunit beta [Coriobacteriales bacterium]|nr:glycine--tRNA ligase subunit beta [Coriobacteriales bacterium]